MAEPNYEDIDRRISVQAFETFRYDQQFDAILIPTNTFSMLTTQDAQIRTLQNIHAQLAPGGRLLLDFRLAGMRDLADYYYAWLDSRAGRALVRPKARRSKLGWKKRKVTGLCTKGE